MHICFTRVSVVHAVVFSITTKCGVCRVKRTTPEIKGIKEPTYTENSLLSTLSVEEFVGGESRVHAVQLKHKLSKPDVKNAEQRKRYEKTNLSRLLVQVLRQRKLKGKTFLTFINLKVFSLYCFKNCRF